MSGYMNTFRDYLKTRALRFAGLLMSINDPQWGKRSGGNQGPPRS